MTDLHVVAKPFLSMCILQLPPEMKFHVLMFFTYFIISPLWKSISLFSFQKFEITLIIPDATYHWEPESANRLLVSCPFARRERWVIIQQFITDVWSAHRVSQSAATQFFTLLGYQWSHTLASPTGYQTSAASCDTSSKQYALNHVTTATKGKFS